MNSAIPDRLSAALAGRYRIERELGAGGMATVYLAEDLKHDRKVAIKVLKPELAAVLGAERFVQEIRTTAALSHPNILPLFDSGEAGGYLYYVMPYLEGETIREKLNRETQFGVEEAVKVTSEVAEALEYAHQHGVIHRDIKPENILLHAGRPMVMDFGIALAVSAAAGGRMTETGLSLGTPHYMSPEQATADRDINARSDIYSLASVLYEMLTGEPPHMGTSAQQIIMKIISEPVKPATELRKSVPQNVGAALGKALEKLPADRFESAKAFATALANPSFAHGSASATSAAYMRRARLRDPVFRGVAAVAVLFAALAAWGWLREDGRTGAVVRYVLRIPEGEEVAGWGRRIALTPDGTRLVYVGETSRHTRPLMVRPRDQLHATPLAGTEGAEMPFVSPDGERVGFFSPRGTIRIVPLAGGNLAKLVDSLVGFAGATWGRDGYIYSDGKGHSALVRVRVAGGVAEPFTTLDSATGEEEHIWPEALPNGKGVLFIVVYAGSTESSLAVADVATGRHHVLAGNALYATYVESGYVIYVTRQGALMAQRFDQGNLSVSGNPFLVEEKVSIGSGNAVPNFTPELVLSSSGTLMYFANTDLSDSTDVVWVDRSGSVRIVDPAWTDQVGQGVALSPDGKWVAYPTGGEVWVKELDRGPRRKITFNGGDRPAWSADGKQIMYRGFVAASAGQPITYSIRNADGTGTASPMRLSSVQVLEANMSADGKWITYREGGGGESDLYARRTQGDTTPVPLVVSPDQETQATLSPDSRWLAYTTLESGRPEVWVRTFPDVESGRWKVSPSGGQEPRWAHSGRELFFRSDAGNMVSVPIGAGSTFTYGDPRVLFSASNFVSATYRRMYDVTSDDQRFIMVRRLIGRPTEELIVVENFPAALQAKVPR